jgi:hypothetical protein
VKRSWSNLRSIVGFGTNPPSTTICQRVPEEALNNTTGDNIHHQTPKLSNQVPIQGAQSTPFYYRRNSARSVVSALFTEPEDRTDWDPTHRAERLRYISTEMDYSWTGPLSYEQFMAQFLPPTPGQPSTISTTSTSFRRALEILATIKDIDDEDTYLKTLVRSSIRQSRNLSDCGHRLKHSPTTIKT